MIELGTFQPQTNRYRPLSGGAIGVKVADVVDVQHGDREQTTARGRQQEQRVYRRGLHKVAANHADPAEEDEYGQIAKPGIAVGRPASRVSDRRSNGRPTEGREQQRQQKPFRAEGKPQKCQAGADRRQGAKQDSPAHLGRRYEAALYGPLRPLTFAGVGPIDRVAIVVGEIGENLQQNSSQQTKQGDKPAKDTCGGRQCAAHDDAGGSQRQRARTHRIDPDRSPVCDGS